jgi:hypothetical protein
MTLLHVQLQNLISKKDEIKEKVNDCKDILHKLPNNYFME